MCTKSNIGVNVRQYDPTFTLTLRNAFVSGMNKRWKTIARQVTQLVYTDDFFGLNERLQVNNIPNAQANIDSFVAWLKRAEANQFQKPWVDQFIQTAYDKGIKRARAEMRKAGVEIGSAEQSLQELLGDSNLTRLPYHVDALGTLYARTFASLEGITAEVNTRIVQILSEGLVAGQSPRRLAQLINSALVESKVDIGLKISYTTKTGKDVTYFMSGRRRAEILARTEVIRAHHVATINEYKRWGVQGVKVLAELVTAGDARVCPSCASLQGTVWLLDDIMTLIPVHPQCRCIALPYFEK